MFLYLAKTVNRYTSAEVSNLFEPRAILTQGKYWWAKQTNRTTFCPKIIVISKKKGLHFDFILNFAIFLPESLSSIKKKKKSLYVNVISSLIVIPPKLW